MPVIRQPIPGAVHHIIAQFIDRDFLINDDASRARFLELLGRAMSESDWKCLAYAIMSNHLHYAMLAGNTPMERWSRRVHSPFALWTNRRLERVGPLFSGDPSMWVVRPENVRRLVAYIHNNPVRAGVVQHARESSWTSHRAYLGLVRYPWLDTSFGLDYLRLDAAELDAYVDQNVGYQPAHGVLDGIHRAARKRGALEVATPFEGSRVEAPLVSRRFANIRPDAGWVLDVVADVTSISAVRMKSRSRDSAVILARAVAVQTAREVGLSISAMAAALGISRQRGSQLALLTLPAPDAAAVVVVATRVQTEVAKYLSNWKGT